VPTNVTHRAIVPTV